MKSQIISENDAPFTTFSLDNDNGFQVEIIEYGARISKILVPKDGKQIDVVAGFDQPSGFCGENPYFNAVIGRVANRIGGASFRIGDKTYPLYKNDGNNHLHGGKEGFDRKRWQGERVDRSTVRLTYTSADGEEGYPGTLKLAVTYSVGKTENSLTVSYEAVSDADTLCALTNHAYFNLDGTFETIRDHEVFIDADLVTAVDEELIPCGDFAEVDGTPYDFRTAKPLGQDIDADFKMLRDARGYDINYVLNNEKDKLVATAYSPKSGVKMSVKTDFPCMQLYTGNFLDGLVGKKKYGFQSAFCMETQGFPNACNIPAFPSMLLKKGERYERFTSYIFE